MIQVAVSRITLAAMVSGSVQVAMMRACVPILLVHTNAHSSVGLMFAFRILFSAMKELIVLKMNRKSAKVESVTRMKFNAIQVNVFTAISVMVV